MVRRSDWEDPTTIPMSALPEREKEFFIHNLLVRIQSIIEMILINRPCAMGV
jgi:hypothetical protein